MKIRSIDSVGFANHLSSRFALEVEYTDSADVVLKRFDRASFVGFRSLVCSYPLLLDTAGSERLERIKSALLQVDLARLPVRLRLCKEDFRFLTVIVDIISVCDSCRGGESFELWHSYFVMLQKIFRRVFKENVYEDE